MFGFTVITFTLQRTVKREVAYNISTYDTRNKKNKVPLHNRVIAGLVFK